MTKAILCLAVIAMFATINALPADSANSADAGSTPSSSTAVPNQPNSDNPANKLFNPLAPLNGILKTMVLAKQKAVNGFLNMIPGGPKLPTE